MKDQFEFHRGKAVEYAATALTAQSTYAGSDKAHVYAQISTTHAILAQIELQREMMTLTAEYRRELLDAE